MFQPASSTKASETKTTERDSARVTRMGGVEGTTGWGGGDGEEEGVEGGGRRGPESAARRPAREPDLSVS